jgi:hypothetical protein
MRYYMYLLFSIYITTQLYYFTILHFLGLQITMWQAIFGK